MPTYPSEAWPADAAIEALDATTDQLTGLPFVAKGVSAASSPTAEVQHNRRWDRLFAILDEASALRVGDEGGLNIGVYPGYYTLGGTQKLFDGATAQAVNDDDTSYIYLDASNALQIVTDATGWPVDLDVFVPLAEVTAASGDITAIVPVLNRARIVIGGGSAAAGTDSTSWTLDQDNTGAGVDTSLIFNRGTTDDDAELRWNETDDRFELYADGVAEDPARLLVEDLLLHSDVGLDGALIKFTGGVPDQVNFRRADDAGDMDITCGGLTVSGATSGIEIDDLTDNNYARVLAADQVVGGELDGSSLQTFSVYNGNVDRVDLKATSAGLQVRDSAGYAPCDCEKLLIGGVETISASGAYVSATLPAVDIPDAGGSSPVTCSLQVEDDLGSSLTGVHYFAVSVHDSIDGGSGFAANATIAVGANGTLIESLTATKELFCKTDASGQLDITVTDGTAESVFVVARPFRRSHRLDCSDVGTVTIS